MKVLTRDVSDIYEEAFRNVFKTKIYRFRMGSAIFADFSFSGYREDAFDYYEIHHSEYFRYSKSGFQIISNKLYFNKFMENERRWRHILQITDFFDFVCRDGVLTSKDVPPEAGLMYLRPGAEIEEESKTIKAAPRRMALLDGPLLAAIASRTMKMEERTAFLASVPPEPSIKKPNGQRLNIKMPKKG